MNKIKLTCVIWAEPLQRVDNKLTVVDTDGMRHFSSELSVDPSLRTNSSIRPGNKNSILQNDTQHSCKQI